VLYSMRWYSLSISNQSSFGTGGLDNEDIITINSRYKKTGSQYFIKWVILVSSNEWNVKCDEWSVKRETWWVKRDYIIYASRITYHALRFTSPFNVTNPKLVLCYTWIDRFTSCNKEIASLRSQWQEKIVIARNEVTKQSHFRLVKTKVTAH
jgi:hypothetical protein